MGEASHRSDVLFSDISLSGSVVLGSTSFSLSDSVDLFVEFGSVEITFLTSSGNSPGNSRGMPSSDTSDLSVTSVRFLLQVSNTPSLDNTSETLTLGNTNNVDEFVLVEDLINSDFFFEKSVSEVNLISNSFSTVDLDFKDVVLLLSEVFKEVHLSVTDGSDNGTVFGESVELNFDSFGVLAVFSLIVGESLFVLGAHPVFIESSKSSLVQMVGPDGTQSSESSWSFDVSNQTDNFKWWGLKDSDGFDFLFLIELGLGSVDISQNVSHTGFESSESGEVTWLGSIISGE